MMKRIFAISALFIAQSVFAHPGHEVASGAIAGMMHPLTGLDHLVALISAGVLMAQTAPQVRWLGITALIFSLAAGAGIAISGVELPWSEWAIGLSIVVAIVVLLYSHRFGAVQPALLIGGTVIFAIFHGYAHGAEATGDRGGFVAGFLAMSLIIALVAMRAARVVSKRRVRSL